MWVPRLFDWCLPDTLSGVGDIGSMDESPDKTVYRQLREAVTSGRYLPNERLVETVLAESLNVNRIIVRNALARLEQEGLVERERNRGARVRRITFEETLELLEVRGALEGLAARRAAEHATDGDLERLHTILLRLADKRAEKDFSSYSQINQTLHAAILDAADSAALTRYAEMLRSQSSQYRYWTLLVPGRLDQSFEEHRAVVEAIAARDPDAAERALRYHVAAVREATRQAARITGGFDQATPAEET